MYLYSDPTDDIRHPKNEAGAYEWWYFDALDPISGYGIVIIFYDGLLFSPNYHACVRHGMNSTADHHPGFSLSIYNADKTQFYSLASYPKASARFDKQNTPVLIGDNRVEVVETVDKLIYLVNIDETLPSGLRANGILRFETQSTSARSESGNINSPHKWNLIQPGAGVTGEVHISHKGKKIDTCTFDTKGYHDHNIGLRPLEHDFDDWYWGRIHIGEDTLVWYNMCSGGIVETTAWMFEKGEVDLSRQISMVPVGDVSKSIFGLKRMRSWAVNVDNHLYHIVEDKVWDRGPFYERYKVNLLDADYRAVDSAIPGIAEYIVPNRITANWVRPMIKVRHHHAGKRGNWIQRSLILSRHTW